MNNVLLSGRIVKDAELVSDSDGEPFLIGSISAFVPRTVIDDMVEIAVIYDQGIAKIPYWELNVGDYVYLQGEIINKELLFNNTPCNSWFFVKSIEHLPPIELKLHNLSPMEISLMDLDDFFKIP